MSTTEHQSAIVLTEEEWADLAEVSVNYLFETRKFKQWTGAVPGSLDKINRQRDVCCRIAAAVGCPYEQDTWMDWLLDHPNWLTEEEQAAWQP